MRPPNAIAQSVNHANPRARPPITSVTQWTSRSTLLAATAVAIEHEPLTAYEVVPLVHGRDAVHAAAWLLTETLCYLRHLEAIGAARRVSDPPTHPERWVAV